MHVPLPRTLKRYATCSQDIVGGHGDTLNSGMFMSMDFAPVADVMIWSWISEIQSDYLLGNMLVVIQPLSNFLRVSNHSIAKPKGQRVFWLNRIDRNASSSWNESPEALPLKVRSLRLLRGLMTYRNSLT